MKQIRRSQHCVRSLSLSRSLSSRHYTKSYMNRSGCLSIPVTKLLRCWMVNSHYNKINTIQFIERACLSFTFSFSRCPPLSPYLSSYFYRWFFFASIFDCRVICFVAYCNIIERRHFYKAIKCVRNFATQTSMLIIQCTCTACVCARMPWYWLDKAILRQSRVLVWQVSVVLCL